MRTLLASCTLRVKLWFVEQMLVVSLALPWMRRRTKSLDQVVADSGVVTQAVEDFTADSETSVSDTSGHHDSAAETQTEAPRTPKYNIVLELRGSDPASTPLRPAGAAGPGQPAALNHRRRDYG